MSKVSVLRCIKPGLLTFEDKSSCFISQGEFVRILDWNNGCHVEHYGKDALLYTTTSGHKSLEQNLYDAVFTEEPLKIDEERFNRSRLFHNKDEKKRIEREKQDTKIIKTLIGGI